MLESSGCHIIFYMLKLKFQVLITIHTFHSTTTFKSTSLHLCTNLTASSNDCFTALWDPWVWDCTCVFFNSEDKLWKRKSAQGLAELIIWKMKESALRKRCKLLHVSNRTYHCLRMELKYYNLLQIRSICHFGYNGCKKSRYQHYIVKLPKQHTGTELQITGLKS